jgi:release factor glutamine methyltransferase
LTLLEVYRSVLAQLRTAEISGAETEARVICSHFSGLSPEKFLQLRNDETDATVVDSIAEAAARRVSGEPLAYIIGSAEFYGYSFVTPRGVLIPRPATESLVELVLAQFPASGKPVRFLDLCCGTGCIGITLLLERQNAHCTFADISDTALTATRENAARHSVSDRAEVTRGDVFSPAGQPGGFDAILCNPPYIRTADMTALDGSVKDFEPGLALDGGIDGLDYYRYIAVNWNDKLLPGGLLAFECGFDQAGKVAELLRREGFADVSIKKDLSGIPRIVAGTYQ